MASRGSPSRDVGPVARPRFDRAILAILTVVTVSVHGFGFALPHALWGADAYGYLPWPAFAAGVTLTTLAVAWILAALSGARGPAGLPAVRVHPFPAIVVVTLAAGVTFWLMRAQHVFLGDGLVIITSLAHTTHFHPLEPLAFLMQRGGLYVVEALGWAASVSPVVPGLEPFMPSWLGSALVSVVSGVVFVPIAIGIAAQLERLRTHDEATEGLDPLAIVLAAVCIGAQGFMQLFFGYVEVYASYLAGSALYVFLALRYLTSGAPLWHAAAALGLTVGLHLSGLALVPSFGVLLLHRLVKRADRPGLARDLLATAACFAAMTLGLFIIGGGYDLAGTALKTAWELVSSQPVAPGYFLSLGHLQDLANESMLVGPLGLLLFVLTVLICVKRDRFGYPGLFFLIAGGGALFATWIAGDSNLGYARNWDLLAPAAMPMTVAGLGLLLMRMRSLQRVRLVLAGFAILSLFHTVPWVALNTSLERSERRFTALPLGHGRVESTLGLWYGLQGEIELAERWQYRALALNPSNLRAVLYLGQVFMQEERYEMASRAYERALEFRPDRDEYGLRLADALFHEGRLERTAGIVARLVAKNPQDAVRHALLAIVRTAWISPALGRGIAVLAMASALVMALFGIWKLRSLLAEEAATRAAEDDLTGRALSIVDRLWPWLASIYAIGVFVIAVSRPEAGLPFIAGATGQSLLAIVVGTALVALISRTIRRGVPLPAALRFNLPRLERRLNAVMPQFLKLLRLIVLIAVVLAVIDAWDLVDVGGWLASPGGETLVGRVISALLIALVGYLIWLGFMSWIEYRLSGGNGHMAGARERTLLSLFGNAITIAVAAVAAMLVLSELGINIGPLLAGAGVIGLAVGFGAQKLVQDIITGVFIQFENAINTGDVVTVAGTTGVVERLSVRSIGIRDVAGTYHLIPFSAVDQVSNFNRGFAYHVAEVGIAYKESVADAKEAMFAAFERLKHGELGVHLLDDLEMQGVHALGDSAVVVRARLRTAPGQQWAIGRAYNEAVKEVFDERGIDIPFPHMTVYAGTDKDGKTQLDGLLPAPG